MSLCFAGVEKIIVTAGSLPEAESALALAQTDGKFFPATFTTKT